MTDTPKCKPGSEWIGYQFHYLLMPSGLITEVDRWCNGCWDDFGDPEDVAKRGIIYLGPVTPHAEVEALRRENATLKAERDKYESPAWEANERLNTQVDDLLAAVATLRARVTELEGAAIDALSTLAYAFNVGFRRQRDELEQRIEDGSEILRHALKKDTTDA